MMKKTQQVLGLPVIEISSGEQMGSVSGIVVNPEQGQVECLLLDRVNWYGEMRALSFGSVLGIGEFAVTISQGNEVFPVSSREDLVAILERDIQVIKAGVMTKSGKFIGNVTEFEIDEANGKILNCEILAEDGGSFVVSGSKVLTFGAKFLVLEDGYMDPESETKTVVEKSPEPVKPAVKTQSEPAPEPEKPVVKPQSKPAPDPVEVFEARQRQYLAGKKATKKIVGTGGQVIVNEGEVITEEIIEKALAADKYIELTMNVAD